MAQAQVQNDKAVSNKATSNIEMNLDHMKMANAIRVLALDGVKAANSGHTGMPMGMADIATVLYSKFLQFDPKNPHWFNRDRVIISNGHGSMLPYSLAYLTGNEKITLDELKNFRQLGSHTPGHLEVDFDAAIDTTTGPLGQGISNAVGFALAERILNEKHGDKLDHYTYCFLGDGCVIEGVSHESCSLAGHLKLSKLIAFYDDNKVTIKIFGKMFFKSFIVLPLFCSIPLPISNANSVPTLVCDLSF